MPRVVTLDSLTFTATVKDGRWTVHNPQLNIRVTAAGRLDALAECQRKAFARFYEIDAERRLRRAN